MAPTALKHTTPGIALVTGGSSGVGRAAAVSLNRAGWTVVICARRAEALQETINMMEDQARSHAIVADVSEPEDVTRCFEEIRQKYGRLDLLFNNAGISSPKLPLDELPLEAFQEVCTINIQAPFQCAQEAIKIMKSQTPQGGRIINNGSISAYVPRPQSVAYTMSKHAISGLTKCIALDYREYNIACSQLDIGNAASSINKSKANGAIQANGQMLIEPYMDAEYTGEAIVYMASMPLHVNILNQTLMATNMPFVGRG